jgi:biotin carboxylase
VALDAHNISEVSVPRILLFTATTGYQTRSFEDASAALGVELLYATDHCHRLDDPWRDGAIAVNFRTPPESAQHVVRQLRGRSIDGVLALGDLPAVVAAHAAEALELPWHSPDGAMAARDKLLAKGRFLASGLPVPWFVALEADAPFESVADRVRFPCVVKPAALSASRGVMRADDPDSLQHAIVRVRRLLQSPDITSLRDPALARLVIEGFVPGREYALEGIVNRGVLHVLAVFDKPDPLDGPFFEETIYVTPAVLPSATERLAAGVVAHGVHALGLGHGPVHAEFRINEDGIFLLEVAGRPIGGLCARALRFESPHGSSVTLEELLLRHAVGEALEGFVRERRASGVMMIPVPARGHFRNVDGLEDARAVAGVEAIVMTAKPGQMLEPWPEGHSYPGFIFARGDLPEQVTQALRVAHGRLRLRLDTALPLA